METKRKRKWMNLFMMLLILVIGGSGVLTVGKIQGWFEKTETAAVSSGVIKGIANIQRQGIGYTLQHDTVLRSGDQIETKDGAQAELYWKENGSLTLHEKTEVTLTSCEAEEGAVTVTQGEVFGDMLQYSKCFAVVFKDHKAALENAVFDISVQTGSSRLNLYAGTVSVLLSDGTQEQVEAGECLSVTEDSSGSISCRIQKLQPESFSDFQLTQAQNCSSADALCFTVAELQKAVDERISERQAVPEASETNSCTVTIRCDTILENMEKLDDGKKAYVPANGLILAASQVEFEEGETVFDVLKHVCEAAGIQIEYSWTPMYNSYYIEGINQLYEFDCGNESGWMYQVNGCFPNYGCSSYELEAGDDIVWCYTCNGLGADVGAPAY